MIPLAHGLSGRADLPMPDWLFGWAAAVVLASSFFAMAALWQRPVLETARPRALWRLPAYGSALTGAVGVILFALLVVAGMTGTQESSSNILPTFVYVAVWSVLPAASALFGDVFRAFNPWLAVGRALRFALSKLARRRLVPPLAYPARVGCRPAAALLIGFGYVELIHPGGRDPSTLATLMLAYAGLQLAGMGLFGVEHWAERADAFGVYFNLFSRIAPLTCRDRRLSWRTPLSGLSDLGAPAGMVAFVCAAIGITAFDGFQQTPLWDDCARSLSAATGSLGFSSAASARLTATAGLMGSILIVAGLFRLGVAGMSSGGVGMSASRLAATFAPSLVPIALAYVVAHYLSFVVFQGQALWSLASDPLGRGWDLFGTAGAGIDYGLLSSTKIWSAQVGALIAGHVAGLAVAHDKALALWGRARAAVRSQLWMLVVMVGFTNLGLWLLSQANG